MRIFQLPKPGVLNAVTVNQAAAPIFMKVRDIMNEHTSAVRLSADTHELLSFPQCSFSIWLFFIYSNKPENDFSSKKVNFSVSLIAIFKLHIHIQALCVCVCIHQAGMQFIYGAFFFFLPWQLQSPSIGNFVASRATL